MKKIKHDKWWIKTKGRKLSRSGLVAKVDETMSRYVIKRDKGICVTCGSTKQPTNGHLFSRAAYSTRWDEGNCFCQCWPCNYLHERDAHPFTSWYVHKFGLKAYDNLHYKYNKPLKADGKSLKDWELAEIMKEFQEKLKLLQ